MRAVRGRAARNGTLQMGLKSLEAARKLEKQGILPGDWSDQPHDERPGVPRDITTMGDRELMELYRKLEHWVAYLGLQLAAAQIDERYAEYVVEKISAYIQIANKAEKNVSTMKALAFEDPDYIKAREDSLAAYAYRKKVNVVYDNTDRAHSDVSRELTRRIGRNDRGKRADRSA